jgi:hypothetical protein
VGRDHHRGGRGPQIGERLQAGLGIQGPGSGQARVWVFLPFAPDSISDLGLERGRKWWLGSTLPLPLWQDLGRGKVCFQKQGSLAQSGEDEVGEGNWDTGALLGAGWSLGGCAISGVPMVP